MPLILVVDDEQANRELMLMLLREAGHTVHAASNGAAALEQLKTDPCDLLVTDMYMPVMDGIELIMQCREIRPDLPIVAISGGDWATHTGRLADADFRLADAGFMGTVETVHKPYDIDDLYRAVARALGEPAAPPH